MTNFYATTESVGDWSGKEEIAVKQFNAIVDEIIARAGNNPDKISDAVKDAWNQVGSEESLLDMSDRDLQAIARKYA